MVLKKLLTLLFTLEIFFGSVSKIISSPLMLNNCAVRCTLLACKYYDLPVTESFIKERIPNNGKSGLNSLLEVSKTLQEAGLHVKGVACEIEDLKKHTGSFILVQNTKGQTTASNPIYHFVFAYYDKVQDQFVIADATNHNELQYLTSEKLKEVFAGKALLIFNAIKE